MSLFINSEQHHNMYKSKENIHGKNQATFRRDHLTELLREQQKMNDILQKSVFKLGLLNEQRDQRQLNQWEAINERLGQLEKVNSQQDQRELQIMKQLNIVTDENKKLQMVIKNNHVSNREIADQIKEYRLNSERISQQLTEQEKSQVEVLKKLDNQEALTEKMLRQMSNLRSTLFERTNDLAEKIEDSYKITSSYLYQILTGNEQPLTFYMHSKHEKEK